MKLLIIGILLNSVVFSVLAAISPHDAARRADLDTLRKYRFENKDLYLPDARGFIPYELAALHANVGDTKNLRKHVEVMLWLKELNASKHRYGGATIKLIQTGLKTLGYNISSTDGVLGEKTITTIKAYQSNNKFAVTGRPGPHWLGAFYRDVIKKLQQNLAELEGKAVRSDGLLGKYTRSLLLKYRKKYQLTDPNYPYIDALIVGRIAAGVHQKKVAIEKENKAKQAKKEALAKKAALAEKAKVMEKNLTRNQIYYIQSGLRLLNYPVGKADGYWGKRTTAAIKQLQKLTKLPVTGKVDERTSRMLDTVFTKAVQKKLKALGYRIGKTDGRMGRQTQFAISAFNKKYRIRQKPVTTGVMMNRLKRVVNKKGLIKRKVINKKTAKKAVPKKTVTQSVVIKKIPIKQKTTKKSLPKKIAVEKSNNKNKVLEKVKISKINNRDNKKQLVTKPRKQISEDVVIQNQKRKGLSISKVQHKGKREKGRMTFVRKSGRVVGCRLAGRNIPIEWCESFYPLPDNNYCEASFSISGTVTNLWCK